MPGETEIGAVVQESFDCGSAVDKPLPCTASAMFNLSYTLVANSQQYTIEQEEVSNWQAVKKRQMETAMLPLVFFEVPLNTAEVQGLNCPPARTLQVLEVDKNRNFFNQEMRSSAGITTGRDQFCHGTVRFFERGASSYHIHGRDLLQSDVGIGLVDEKSWVVSLPSIAMPLMVDEELEDVVAENGSGSGAELSSTGRKALEQMQIVTKSVSIVYEVLFRRLLEAVEWSGADIREVVHALNRETPSNTDRVEKLSDPDHDWPSMP